MDTRVRASVVCVDKGELLRVRLRDPVGPIARLFAPGGRVETPETAAIASAVRALLPELTDRAETES